MLQETEFELAIESSYNDYLDNGGRFAYPEYQFIQDAIENGVYVPRNSQRELQASQTGSICGIVISPEETAIYTILREQIGRYPGEVSIEDSRAKSACCMVDEELLREIFLFTDTSGEKYLTLTERLPHIFNNL